MSLEPESLEDRVLLAADFASFAISDASQDSTSSTVFESSALALDYNLDLTGSTLERVDLFARGDEFTYKLGEYDALSADNTLVNLNGFLDFAGEQEIFAVSFTADGQSRVSDSVFVDVLETTFVEGDLLSQEFAYGDVSEAATVYSASGGTDFLEFDFARSEVVDFNGGSIFDYDNDAFVTSQAFYQGTAYDYLTLQDGREIYFQGIDVLTFDDATVQLQTQPNDPWFQHQWEVSIGDVGDAWRFTRGSDDVLLVSLDTGVPEVNGEVVTSDLDLSRHDFIVDPNNSLANGDHGHRATSVMTATANNGIGHAGINWNSQTLVIDVYGGTSIDEAIEAGLARLDEIDATRVVFQGGIQGEFWLNRLDQSLIENSVDNAIYAIAAGNGGQDISLTTNSVFSGGVARLASTYDNVWAIGALTPGATTQVNGIRNATNPGLAGYSNRGDDLTFAVSTNTPSVHPNGNSSFFSGTSNSNPVAAAYASLVWSVNPDLSAGEVGQIFIDTVSDIGDEGRDPTFGHGVPNLGEAVRRAWTIAENPELADLAENSFAGDDAVSDFDGKADLLSPVAGSTLSGDTQTFTWTDEPGATNYFLFVGTTEGGNDLYSELASGNSATVSDLPVNSEDVYVRLWTRTSEFGWQFNDYQFTAAADGRAELLTPTDGSVLSGDTETFTWAEEVNATGYYVFVGTTAGGFDLHASFETGTSVTVSDLPVNSEDIYVRLWTRTTEFGWQFNEYQFTAAADGRAELLTPTDRSVLGGDTETFTWAEEANATGYYVFVGTTAGGFDLHASFETGTSVTVSDLPVNSEDIYVRLWTQTTEFGWQYNEYQFTAAPDGRAELLSHESGAVLSGATETFSWAEEADATGYYVFVGTQVGRNDIHSQFYNTDTSANISGLPTNGEDVYVRLWTRTTEFGWQFNDYDFTAHNLNDNDSIAELVSHADGQTLGSTETFEWNAEQNATNYFLFVGTTVGGTDIFIGGTTGLSQTVSDLPVDQTIYVRLWTFTNGWQSVDYVFGPTSPLAPSLGGTNFAELEVPPEPLSLNFAVEEDWSERQKIVFAEQVRESQRRFKIERVEHA